MTAKSHVGPASDVSLPYHAHMVALYVVWYSFCCIHKSRQVIPAMSANGSALEHG
jgi:hypothetical protein